MNIKTKGIRQKNIELSQYYNSLTSGNPCYSQTTTLLFNFALNILQKQPLIDTSYDWEQLLTLTENCNKNCNIYISNYQWQDIPKTWTSEIMAHLYITCCIELLKTLLWFSNTSIRVGFGSGTLYSHKLINSSKLFLLFESLNCRAQKTIG